MSENSGKSIETLRSDARGALKFTCDWSEADVLKVIPFEAQQWPIRKRQLQDLIIIEDRLRELFQCTQQGSYSVEKHADGLAAVYRLREDIQNSS